MPAGRRRAGHPNEPAFPGARPSSDAAGTAADELETHAPPIGSGATREARLAAAAAGARAARPRRVDSLTETLSIGTQ